MLHESIQHISHIKTYEATWSSLTLYKQMFHWKKAMPNAHTSWWNIEIRIFNSWKKSLSKNQAMNETNSPIWNRIWLFELSKLMRKPIMSHIIRSALKRTFQWQISLSKPHFSNIPLNNFFKNPWMQRSNSGLFKLGNHLWMKLYCQIAGVSTCMLLIFHILHDSWKNPNLTRMLSTTTKRIKHMLKSGFPKYANVMFSFCIKDHGHDKI